MEQMGVYKLYKLGRLNNTSFTTEHKVLERDLHVITNEWAEFTNFNSEKNGLLYVKDENATKLYFQKKPFKAVKEYVEFSEVKDEEIIKEEEIVIKAKDAKPIEGDLKELRHKYRELSGKEWKPLWGVKKLTEEINLLDTK